MSNEEFSKILKSCRKIKSYYILNVSFFISAVSTVCVNTVENGEYNVNILLIVIILAYIKLYGIFDRCIKTSGATTLIDVVYIAIDVVITVISCVTGSKEMAEFSLITVICIQYYLYKRCMDIKNIDSYEYMRINYGDNSNNKVKIGAEIAMEDSGFSYSMLGDTINMYDVNDKTTIIPSDSIKYLGDEEFIIDVSKVLSIIMIANNLAASFVVIERFVS